MKTIHFDGISIEYSTEDKIRYSCYVQEHDIYFSARDMQMMKKKAKAMIYMQKKFMNENPEYLKK